MGETKTKQTDYVVLRRQDDDSWKFTNRVSAANREAAAQYVALEISKGAGPQIAEADYIAIPARSFDPIRIKIEVEEKAVVAERLPA